MQLFCQEVDLPNSSRLIPEECTSADVKGLSSSQAKYCFLPDIFDGNEEGGNKYFSKQKCSWLGENIQLVPINAFKTQIQRTEVKQGA